MECLGPPAIGRRRDAICRAATTCSRWTCAIMEIRPTWRTWATMPWPGMSPPGSTRGALTGLRFLGHSMGGKVAMLLCLPAAGAGRTTGGRRYRAEGLSVGHPTGGICGDQRARFDVFVVTGRGRAPFGSEDSRPGDAQIPGDEPGAHGLRRMALADQSAGDSPRRCRLWKKIRFVPRTISEGRPCLSPAANPPMPSRPTGRRSWGIFRPRVSR